MKRRAAVPLPSPGVVFDEELFARLGRFTARLSNARERREGAGKNRFRGIGSEIVGYRPYRPGEDLRMLDWNLYARFEKPFVRVAAREASERWTVLLDTSASMGVGESGKLQRAAEVVTALGAVGLRMRAVVRLMCSSGAEGPRLRRLADLRGWANFLETCRADGTEGLGGFVRQSARLRDAGRVFLVGDLLDLAPADMKSFTRRGRELFCAQILAPEELVPTLGSVEWADAEGNGRRRVEVDRDTLALYERRLGRRLEAWRKAAEHRRVTYVCHASSEPFETIAGDLLR